MVMRKESFWRRNRKSCWSRSMFWRL